MWAVEDSASSLPLEGAKGEEVICWDGTEGGAKCDMNFGVQLCFNA